MQTIQSQKIICFDVDDTLVLYSGNRSWGKNNKEAVKFRDPYISKEYFDSYLYLKPNIEVIELLKTYKAAKWTVIVWSAGGWQWAQEVTKTLGIEEYVDICMSKPERYVDDNPCTVWMGMYVEVTLGGKIIKPELVQPD
jgi:phosphoserine phosphatase